MIATKETIPISMVKSKSKLSKSIEKIDFMHKQTRAPTANKIIKSIKDFKYYYHKFLVERYLYDFKFNKRKVTKNIYSFYKECNHYIEFCDEKEYLNKYFKK